MAVSRAPEARTHGIAPVRRDHPAYAYMRDGDGDGIVCEAGGGEAKGGTARQGSAPATSGSSALRQYDDNGNGRITCAEARRHGIAPVRRGPSCVSLHARCRRGTELSASAERRPVDDKRDVDLLQVVDHILLLAVDPASHNEQ